MIGDILIIFELAALLVCTWHLSQQNVIGGEPFARAIAVSYSLVGIGVGTMIIRRTTLLSDRPELHEALAVAPHVFMLALIVNYVLISLRLNRLYEEKDRT